MYDLIVIGAGPAGISAGIYAKRTGIKVLILYKGKSNVEKATIIDNYYGFKNGINGNELYENGIKQAQNLGIEVKKEEVIDIEKIDDNFNLYTEKEKYSTKTVIIATGNKKIKPEIKGIEEFEGKGISYCAICDGFFYRNKKVAVIGEGKFAIKEIEELQNIAESIILLTNGKDNKNKYENVNTKKIKQIKGDTKIRKIEFEDGTEIDIDGAFIAIGEAGAIDFAKKLGILVKNDSIIVDENMQTNISGMYACGNATGGLLQICKATYEGAKAGLSVANFVKNIKKI